MQEQNRNTPQMAEWYGASASGAVDSRSIPNRVKPMTLNWIHSFPACRSAFKDSVENMPASFLVVPLEKALSGIIPSWCDRQKAGNS